MEVKTFPAQPGSIEINHQDLKQCLFSGLFAEHAECGGENRSFYTYLAPGLHYNRPCVVVVPPDDVPVLEYLERSPWIPFADREQVFLHILEPGEGGWKLDGPDGEFLNKVYMEIQSRRFYVTMQDNIYAVGIGRGATVAQQAAMKMSSEWSGLATFGDLTEYALRNSEAVTTGVNTGATELAVSGAKAQLPVWMAWSRNVGSNAAVCEYWKAQNDVDPEEYASQEADEIYFPRKICKKSQVNEEKIAQVRVTNRFSGEPDADLWSAVWRYLKQARRHRSFGNKALRNYVDPVEYGAELHTMEMDGFTRLWYEYIPDSVKGSETPVPLVVCMHGRGGSADSFLDLSGLTRVAEERNFIAIFPEAGVYQQRPGGLQNVLLWDGIYQGKRVDDGAFVLKAIEDVKSRRAIDASRIYACGQSSGGMMTSNLSRRAPDVFAAVSPWSAIVNPDFPEPLPEKIEPQVPYLFLFGDKDWLCVDRKNGELEYHISKDIAAYLKNLMKMYSLNETPKQYVCGEIHYYVYENRKGTPMLKVGVVSGMTHANYPRESWIAYDEFLCKFSKKEDGTLLYMGEEAT